MGAEGRSGKACAVFCFDSSSPSPSSRLSSASSSSSSSSSDDGEKISPIPCTLIQLLKNSPPSGGSSSPLTERLRFIQGVNGGNMGWREVEQRFDRLAATGADGTPVVGPSEFALCIGMQGSPEFAGELLAALRGRRNSESPISKLELHDHWNRITDPCFSSRTQIFFDLCDRDMDGKITETEIKQAISLSASANKLFMIPEELDDHAALIMDDLDHENKGFIEVSQLKTLFLRGLSLAESLEDQKSAPPDPTGGSAAEGWLRARWRRIWVVAVWLAACLGLFAWKFVQYRRRPAFEVMGYCLCTAKGAAETLKLNMALVLLPVCRNTVTWARRHRLANSVVPFNDNINFHKLIAGGIVVGVILHGGTHLACDFPRIAAADRLLFRRTIAVDFRHHQPSYAEILATTEAATGIAMVLLMAVAFSLATRLPRRSPSSLPAPLRRLAGFNVFWYSHHLFVLVYVLLVVHSMFLFLSKNVAEKTTWMYLAVPVLMYTGERVVRAVRAGFYDVKVLEANTYPGKVLSLKLRKPAGFHYRSGMYIFLQCPQLSQLEWHPFSLTSAPDDDHLSLYIRTLGDWSYRIYSHFQEALLSSGCDFPKVYIDGPYGAAAQDHVKYDIVMLIGLGIGATPFISVLKDIVHALQKSSPNVVDGGESGLFSSPSKTYFYWVTREQGSFDWFKDVMEEISEINKRQGVIEMHNYLTSVHKEGDARSALIAAIQAMHLAKNGVDIVSRTPVYTHFSRPNWSRVFSRLSCTHGGERIGVFYCGPPALAKELKRLCQKMSSESPARFVFHKENH